MTKTLDNKFSMCDRQLATCYLLVKSMYSCYYMCEYLPVKWEHVFDCLIEKVYQLQFNDKVCLTCVRKKYFQLFLSHRVCLTSVFCFCYPQTSFRLKSTLNMCKRKERCGRQQLFLTNLSHRLQWYFLIKKCLSVCGKCFTFLTSSEPQMFPEEVLYLFWVIQIPWWPLCLAYDWPRHLLPFQNYWMSSHKTCTNAHLGVLKTIWRELVFKWRPLPHWPKPRWPSYQDTRIARTSTLWKCSYFEEKF